MKSTSQDNPFFSEQAAPESRRSFLTRLFTIGTIGVGVAGTLSACGGGDAEPSGEAADVPSEVVACENYEGLTEQELAVRQTLNYVPDSPNANQVCSNCRFYVAPAAGETCGGCQLFKGPVNPGGYCTSWAAMPA